MRTCTNKLFLFLNTKYTFLCVLFDSTKVGSKQKWNLKMYNFIAHKTMNKKWAVKPTDKPASVPIIYYVYICQKGDG